MNERQPDRENETYAEAAARLLKVLDERSKKTVSKEPGTTPRTGLQAGNESTPEVARLRYCNENAARVYPDFGPTAPSRSRRGFVVGGFTEHTEGGSTARREQD